MLFMEEYLTEKHMKYLHLSVDRLREWIPFTENELIGLYKETGRTIYEEIGVYHYCLFTWPELNEDGQIMKVPEESFQSERIVLLVFDEDDRIIADLSAIHSSLSSFLQSESLFRFLCEESDWAYLEHYTLCGYYFPELPYPLCEEKTSVGWKETGDVVLYTNAYVTRTFRKQGIFRNMLEMVREFILKNRKEGNAALYQVMALDPDVACYGPDTVSDPYIYNFEKDEPDRLRNADILKRLGFEPIRLEETEEDPQSDGTKLWFACKREMIVIVDEAYIN